MFEDFVPASGNSWDKYLNSSFPSGYGNGEPVDTITPGQAIDRLPAIGATKVVVDLPTPAPATDLSLILLDAPFPAPGDITTSGQETQAVDAITGADRVVEQAISLAGNALTELATDPDFTAKMNLAFGDTWDAAVAGELAQDWLTGDFSKIPPVEMRASAEINGANGAYSGENNSIYLSREFVAGNADNPLPVVSVLLEEIGHYIDSQINSSDAAGDEGAIFAGVVQGQEFDAASLQALKAEDDTAIVMLDGKATLIEQDNTLSAARIVTVGATTSTYRDWVGTTDTNDYYKFTLSNTSNFNLTLNGLGADANVQLLNSSGSVIQSSTNGGTTQDTISRSLSGGTYYVRVYPMSGVNTNYNLSLAATPVYSIGSLSLNQTQSGSLSTTDRANPTRSGSFSDDYRLSGFSTGQQVQLNMSSTAFDSYLQLVNESTGQVIQFDDDSGGNNNSRLTFTAQSGVNYLVRATSYGSNSTGSYTLNAAPVQTQIPATNWKAEYFNNTNLTGSPVFVEDLGSGSQNFSRNWGNGAPTNTPADNFSARMSTQRYLAPGLYKIQATADDGVRVRVNNQTVIDKWVDQPFVTNSGYFRSNGGNVPVTVDYYERGGGAAINFNITPAIKFQDPVDASRQWHATVHSWNSSQGSAPPTNFWEGDYNNPNAIGVINLGSNTRSDGKKGINVDWGSGAPNGDGNRLPHDNFAMRAYTLADFDGSPHKFRVRGDDGFQLLAMNVDTYQWHNITPANQWSQAYGAHSEITYTLPAGRYAMHFHQYEGGGNAYLDLSWERAVPPGYYRDISLSETQWDQQSGDNNQFEQNPYGGGGDQRWKTDDRIEQIYTNLSQTILGNRFAMTAGYAYDQSYFTGQGKWHAGIDIGASYKTPIKAAIGGTVQWISGSGDGYVFAGINSDDGRQWVYGHLQSSSGLWKGKRINAGENVGLVGWYNGAPHLHLEVENGLAYGNTQGAMTNRDTLLGVTVSPLMAYWQWRNR